MWPDSHGDLQCGGTLAGNDGSFHTIDAAPKEYDKHDQHGYLNEDIQRHTENAGEMVLQ